ncbi:MAG: molybdopterin-dependent oxidoreductase [Actinomycetota bacterium]
MNAEEKNERSGPDENASAGEPEQKHESSERSDSEAEQKTADVQEPAGEAAQESAAGAESQPGDRPAQPLPTEAAADSPLKEKPVIAKPPGFFAERDPEIIAVPRRTLKNWTRRDLLLFGAGVAATIVGGGFLLPQDTLARLGIRGNTDTPGKERFLNHALNFDDDVAEALYSKNRMVPTYSKSDVTPLRNNYNGLTPDPDYIPGWRLMLEGLASGLSVSLDIQNLLTQFPQHEQVTRLVCVEGWSAIAWWSGLRWSDLLRAYPPAPGARWARVDSSVNLDADGNPDPYYMSLDLATAEHPQTLLATHYNGEPLTAEHGAPLRLLVPVKLGLKNVKAITRIAYSVEQPRDYWAERGYSHYDGL